MRNSNRVRRDNCSVFRRVARICSCMVDRGRDRVGYAANCCRYAHRCAVDRCVHIVGRGHVVGRRHVLGRGLVVSRGHVGGRGRVVGCSVCLSFGSSDRI